MDVLQLPSACLRVGGVLRQTFVSIRDAEAGLDPLDTVKRRWAERMLAFTGVRLEVRGAPSAARPTIFAGNHLSYLDIPVLLSQVPHAGFIAKAELGHWPLFGRGMALAGTVFVRRGSPRSRGLAREELRRVLSGEGRSVVIFPSGTTSLAEDVPWRSGAFRLAQETGVPLQLFRVRYRPGRLAAFLGDDSLIPHLLRLCLRGEVIAELEFAPPRVIQDWRRELEEGRSWCRAGLSAGGSSA